mmetsp:Transcript_40420/g.63943  ORF Transcript_40420/g.63943 Transcript_40420/m.63943 type:complete len:225 (-) Transcript_40420:26-700(-)
MLQRKVEGIWPCFVHLRPSKASCNSIVQWVNETVPLILSKNNLSPEELVFVEKNDLHVSITPGLMLQKHEFQMMTSLTERLIESLSKPSHSAGYTDRLTYDRKTHLGFLSDHNAAPLRTLTPVHLRVQSLNILGEYLVLEFTNAHSDPTLSVLNEYYRKTCEIFHQETYEERYRAFETPRIFHCSVGKFTKLHANSNLFRTALQDSEVDFTQPIEITELRVSRE